MKRNFKKYARTLITYFPFIKDQSYAFKRLLRILLNSSVEEDFNALKLFPHREDVLFLDIGANQGAALDVFLKRHKHCNICSFEPNPHAFQKIESRFKKNARVKLHNFGLGAREGTFKFYVPVYRGYEFDGWGSLSPDFDDSWLSRSILFYNRKFLQMREIECVIKRLDDLGLEPFFMKIDVQGAELDVVRGGETTIKKSRPIILLESGKRDDEIKTFLSQFQYRLYRFTKGKFIEGQRGSPNSFFMTDDKYELITRPRHKMAYMML
ncbi:MAG TPA: FkbM family methyltransferase [Anaerolineales bacterium]|nr:FkbM family methyltransferase [Anaerolineales bacterium]